MNKKKCLIIDLDGTLADITSRREELSIKKDWDSFFLQISGDLLNLWCKEIINKFKSEFSILLVTGRPRNYEALTINWLKKNDVNFDSIFFRGAGDFRSDDIVKREIYHNHIKPHYEVLFVVDDRQKVVDMWRSEGLVCLQCDKGDF